jgi:hypothetical protein
MQTVQTAGKKTSAACDPKKIIHQDIEQSPLAKTPVLLHFSIGDTLQPTEIIFHNGWIEARC